MKKASCEVQYPAYNAASPQEYLRDPPSFARRPPQENRTNKKLRNKTPRKNYSSAVETSTASISGAWACAATTSDELPVGLWAEVTLNLTLTCDKGGRKGVLELKDARVSERRPSSIMTGLMPTKESSGWLCGFLPTTRQRSNAFDRAPGPGQHTAPGSQRESPNAIHFYASSGFPDTPISQAMIQPML
jgi:hypothetical protein